MKTQSWLWPDRTIGKRESRELREEYNAVVNLNSDLLEALKLVVNSNGHWHLCTGHTGTIQSAVLNDSICDRIRASIAKAEGL